MVVAWCERRATETACRGRSYGAARRGSSGEMPSCIVLWLVIVVECVISGVSGEYVVRWC